MCFPECIARVPVSLWGSGGWGCVRSTLPNRPQPSATVRNRPQPSVWGPYGRAYKMFCKRGHFWRFHMWCCFVSHGRRGTSWHSDVFCNVSKVVLCGRRNTFATFSKDALQFSWQARHFGPVHRHFAWQAQHFRCVVPRIFANRNWQGCVKWRQGANSVAGMAFCETGLKCCACHAKQHDNLLGNLRRFAAYPKDTARPQENQRLETRYVGASKRAFRARLPPILTLCSFKIDVFLRVFLRTWKYATSNTLHFILYTLHFTLHTLHFTLHTLHSTLHTYTPHSTLHTARSTLYTPHFTPYTPHFTFHTLHSTLYAPHFRLYTLHCTLHTPHFTLHTLHFTLHTPHFTFTLYTPHCTLHTPHSTLHTLHFTLDT